MFKDEYHPKIKKDLNKLDPQVLRDIKNIHINKILEGPFKSPKLTAVLSDVHSYHFRKNNVDYRICYLINSEDNIIYFLMIGPRENIYDVLKRRV